MKTATPPTTTRWQQRYTVVGLCALSLFVCYIDRVNISVAILPMQEQYGWSESVKGLVLSSFFLGYLFMQVGGGILANRYGGKVVLGVAVIWWSLFTILTPLAAGITLPVLLLVRVLMGLGEGASTPAAYSMFRHWVPAGERSRAVALLSSGAPLGTLVALTTTGWIVSQFGWETVFYAFGAVGLVWALFWYKLVKDYPRDCPRTSEAEQIQLSENDADHPVDQAIPWKRFFTSAPVWAIIIASFATNWGLYVLLSWLPSYFASAHGLSVTKAGIYSAAPWLTMFAMLNISAWVADRMVHRGFDITLTRKLMQTIGLLGSASCLLLVGVVESSGMALLTICGSLGLLAFCYSGFAPNALDIAPGYADTLWGIINTVGTIPGIIGVAITGWLVETSGTYASAFALTASINLAGAVVWLLFSTAERVIE
jgi:ACS family sodium-dependent inorganic phosphate cotransporter